MTKPAPKIKLHSAEQCRAIPPCTGQHPCTCPGRTGKAHRHRWTTHRAKDGRAVRKCDLCPARQAKESGRWIPLAHASEASRQLATVVFATSVATLRVAR